MAPSKVFHHELALCQFPSASACPFLDSWASTFSKTGLPHTCGLSPSSLIIGQHLIQVPFCTTLLASGMP
eukprot:scaffold38111_cov55-Cyclotella_meneghiniana.AAC.1